MQRGTIEEAAEELWRTSVKNWRPVSQDCTRFALLDVLDIKATMKADAFGDEMTRDTRFPPVAHFVEQVVRTANRRVAVPPPSRLDPRREWSICPLRPRRHAHAQAQGLSATPWTMDAPRQRFPPPMALEYFQGVPPRLVVQRCYQFDK